ncbi:hypothetical protein [Azospirillum sp.]|uniref:hypothetical protein n=1 Tax=Azospirillum sp. TaxID=34012 RepID=UPI002D631D58|nr:hypothetical protein [Azospirillum sp.]HYF87473.1 hypothetical protein [Azospirillum sp.]
MIRNNFKIGVAGTHSTGKSTFVCDVENVLAAEGVAVARIENLATRAQEIGFPILSKHTFESTLWIIAECMRKEMEASLSAQVILVDRPVPDALGYLLAALEVSGRNIGERRLSALRQIVAAHINDYDHLIITDLDPSISLGEGRDADECFRAAAGRNITTIVKEFAPNVAVMTADNAPNVTANAISLVRQWRDATR